jgi:hypothetical protein
MIDSGKEGSPMGDEKVSEITNAATQNDRRERFVRWQDYRITQLGTCNQLLLTFTVATLGFAVAQSQQNIVALSNYWGRACYCLSIICGAVSFICGILTSIMRLQNFRKTAKMTRLKITAPPKRSESDWAEISKLKRQTERLDVWTWRLLYGQMATFAIQALSLAAAFAGKCR